MDRQRTNLIGGGDRSVRRLIVFMRREETAEAGFVMAKRADDRGVNFG